MVFYFIIFDFFCLIFIPHSIMSDFYKKILDNNKKWVEEQLAIDKDYFKEFSKRSKSTIVVDWLFG
jgi:hypothetical protein